MYVINHQNSWLYKADKNQNIAERTFYNYVNVFSKVTSDKMLKVLQ